MDDSQQTFVLILVVIGLIGGIIAPFLIRMKTKSIAVYILGWIWWFLFAFVASQILMALMMLVLGEKVFSSTEFSAMLQAISYFAMFAVMILLPWQLWKNQKNLPAKKGDKSKKKVKKSVNKADTRQFILKLSGLSRKPNLGDVKQYLSFFPIYFVTNMVASIVLTLILGAKVMSQEQNIGFEKVNQGPLSLVIIGICLVVLAPLFEEMLVRGALFSKLRDKVKFWPAALATAGVFALIHGQINVGVMTFILALYAAYLREKTGAIWSGIMLHATQNFIAFCILFLS